ncbi:hypothetical protein KVV02_006247 [Mortierella alpina]|uniref:Dihydrofolate synthase n=1 Tax=Mortierella alpina TaxID=64518 RepID=A0A9P8A1X9_MORAP|nr:hypothetical protein KVV02_006247 [Mortierella alpina]
MDLGLERVTRLLEALAPSASLPPPHLAIPIIHVAGTNGKGSICAFIASILTASGFRVGRYNSPHLITPRDTIQINNQPISLDDYQYVTDLVKQKDAQLDLKATSFELLTAAAFYWFAYGRTNGSVSPSVDGHNIAAVDFAVIEVGVGGRLDATNIVPAPKVCVIASIDMDHAGLLGNSIEEVAFEKAGIIKAKVPVVVAPQPQGQRVYKVVEDKAASVGLHPEQVVKVQAAQWATEGEAPLSNLATEPAVPGRGASLKDGFRFWIPLLGDFQLANSATAIAAIRTLIESAGSAGGDDTTMDVPWKHRITDETIRQGIRDTVWPGRLQWIKATDAPREVQGKMLIDGAHNPAAAIALSAYVSEYTASISPTASVSTSGGPRTHWIMAFTKGKDIEEMFEILFPPSSTGDKPGRQDTFSAVEFSPPEGMPWVSPIPADEVCQRLKAHQERILIQKESQLLVQGFGIDLKAALQWVGNQRQEGDLVVLCGSLYLVADLFRLQ